ncbi:two-component system sensor histidine kinase NtrB [Acanthopleuribacter pedis]|uniref:histidine kinase n=1 Tax=Acanthopleuribacter pedis TaxID=442870 RepID=A0A8J7QGM4_9BACT|nr:ATP-binding protein [Acanthopleuribacter pedis]MBO1319991.1 hypothetical protein [Acanthopleuribacter pedis]
MVVRVLSLILYRAVLGSMILLYQILALVFQFPLLSFRPIVIMVSLISALSLAYVIYLARLLDRRRFLLDLKEEESRFSLNGFVLVQFLIDLIIVSLLVYYEGVVDSSFRFAYLAVILVSAVFLDKFSIYAIMVCSLSMYYVTLVLMFYPKVSHLMELDPLFLARSINPYITGQVVLCFFTALLSGFLQTSYRNARGVLLEKDRNIRSLRHMRRKIVESLPGGLLICDLDGHITFVNGVGMRLLGLDPSQTDSSVNVWASFGLAESVVEEIDLNRPPLRTECLIQVGGIQRTLGVTLSSLEFESGNRGYLFVFQDLTKIKMLEEDKRLMDRMSAVGKMAAGVAHEIRNPLAAISGSIQVLREFLPQEETAHELAEIVDKETRRLNDTISAFLNYARPGTPALLKKLDLCHVLRDFFLLLENDGQYAHLALELSVGQGDFSVLADEGKLNQVLWNLVRNSAKAAGENGRIILECDLIGHEVRCAVRDNGIGMTEDQVNELFTPFRSFSNGTGLGMSVVYEIMQAHKGRIKVDSEPGRGTTVSLLFPRYLD